VILNSKIHAHTTYVFKTIFMCFEVFVRWIICFGEFKETLSFSFQSAPLAFETSPQNRVSDTITHVTLGTRTMTCYINRTP
jgi:hypothetical protein